MMEEMDSIEENGT
jgi:hypothetical protein